MYGSLGLAEALAELTFADLYPEGTKSMRPGSFDPPRGHEAKGQRIFERVIKKGSLSFIAACHELARADQIGPDFITHLPMSFDGRS